jgi:hypothetical protein
MVNLSSRSSHSRRINLLAPITLFSVTLACLFYLGCNPQPEAPPVSSSPAAAKNHAGLVVVYGNGSVETKCVSFAEPQITGYQLVERSSFPFTAEFYASQKSYAMCSFKSEGCTYPSQKCFCQPSFWSYWILKPVGWQSSSQGVSLTSVKNGDVQGFRWGNGSAAPPPTSFESICH